MKAAAAGVQQPVLSWQRMDIEQRLGFPGGKYTDVNVWLALLIGLVLVVVFYLCIVFLVGRGCYAGDMFLGHEIAASEPAVPTAEAPPAADAVEPPMEAKPRIAVSSVLVPFSIVFVAAWSIGVLFLKWRKLALQRRALALDLVPASHDFVLAAGTAPSVLNRMYEAVDDPRRFVLTCRIERALSNLRNIGRISDVTEMLGAQADNDEDRMESSYTIVRGFIWAVPVLGFIGTVLGLSSAIGGFGNVLSTGADLSKLTEHLKGVTGGLSTAFETTLQGLVAALTIQLMLVSLKKKEEGFLDDCREYCHAHIISRLRLIHLDDAIASPEGSEA